MSALFVKDIKDECEFVSDIYSIKKFKFNDIDFYRLEIEVLRDIKTAKGMKVYLYVNKELLGKYEPKVKDNIHGIMQLSAYIDEKECTKIMEESKETAEFITENGRVEYKLEVPASQDEFSNGLAFRDNLAVQNGTFNLNNISGIEVLNEYFERDKYFSLRKFNEQSFGVYQEEPFEVEWLFDKDVAAEAAKYVFHPKQDSHFNEDGTLTVKFTAGGAREMDWHLYTWGEHVKVIKPDDFAKRKKWKE